MLLLLGMAGGSALSLPLGTVLFCFGPKISLALQRRSGAPGGTLGWVILWPGCEEGLAALPGQEGAGMGMGVGLGTALWSHRDLEGEKYKGGRGDTERGDVKLLSMSNGVKVRSLLNTSLSFLDSKFSMVSD